MAGRNTNGYGHVRWDGRLWLAHRAAWAARHGPIPKGFCVCHRCNVRPCVNPDHLFLGTHKDNMTDKATKAGHERRIEGRSERRPSKSPEIIRIHLWGKEFVTRVLTIRPLEPVSAAARSATRSRPADR
jgi:HNH endonuclease